MAMESKENEAVASLIKVQQGLKPVLRNSENPFFKSSYADLCAVWESCIKLLNANGFAVSQATAFSGERFTLITRLMHVSGQVMIGEYWINPKDASDPQKLGSCVTYARRYGLCALVGVVVESDDDDGNKASEPSKHSGDIAKNESANETGVVRFIPQGVKDESFTSKAGKPMKRYKIIGAEGEVYSTIQEKTASLAKRAHIEKKEIDMTYKRDQYGLGVLEIQVVEETELLESNQF